MCCLKRCHPIIIIFFFLSQSTTATTVSYSSTSMTLDPLCRNDGLEDRPSCLKLPICASNMITYANVTMFQMARKINPELIILNRKECSPLINITLDDIHISVKTTRYYEKHRLPVILKTWFQTAKNQTWFFTDKNNKYLQAYTILKMSTDNHMIDTRCPTTHARLDLCCKTSVEFDYYIKSEKEWFCHFDDDNYVYTPRLVETLRKFDHRKDWYLGRYGIERVVLRNISDHANIQYSFRFALFGAGMCLSKSLAYKLVPYAGNGKFMEVCKEIDQNDDVAMGFLVEIYAGQKLTELLEFHSQNDNMKAILPSSYPNQISFAFFHGNLLSVSGFTLEQDPTRFLSLHCFFYPHVSFCLNKTESYKVLDSDSGGALGPRLRNYTYEH